MTRSSPRRAAALALALLALAAALAPASEAVSPPLEAACAGLLAPPLCEALPDATRPPEEACRQVFAEPVCALVPDPRDHVACDPAVPAEACEALARPLGPANAALCAEARVSIEGGCLQWEATIAGATHATHATSDGRHVYVGGRAFGATMDVAVWAFDAATGALAWERVLVDDAGHDVVGDVALSPDGATLAVAANTAAGGDALLLLLDAATGATRWSVAADGMTGDAFGRAVAFSPDGALVVLGATVFATFSHYHCSGWTCWTHAHLHTDAMLRPYETASGAPHPVVHHAQSPDWSESVEGVFMHDDGRMALALTSRAYDGSILRAQLLLARDGTRLSLQSAADGGLTAALGVAPSADGQQLLVPFRGGGSVGLAAFDAATGARAWTNLAPPEATLGVIDWSASPDGATVLFSGIAFEADGTRSGVVEALSAADGARAWRVAVEGAPLAAAPYVHAGADRVVALVQRTNATGSAASSALVLDPRTGDARAEHPVAPPGFGPRFLAPLAAGGVAVGALRYADGAYTSWVGAYDGGLAAAATAAG